MKSSRSGEKMAGRRSIAVRAAASVLALFILVPLAVFGGPSRAFAAETQAVRTFSGAVEETDLSTRLLRNLVESLAPESLELVLEGGPDASGAVRRLYFEARGAKQGGIRIESLRLEALFVKFDLGGPSGNDGSVHGEGNLGDLNVSEAVQGYFEGRVLEKDLNDFLLGATLTGGGAEWRDLRFDLRPGGFSASARFASGVVSARVVVESDLEIEDRDRLRMRNYRISVNNAETDMAMILEAIEKAQPLLDFRDFPFPVRLRELTVDEDALVLATRVAPTRFEGTTLRYEAR
ncbi:DUF2993 domain-containing protein [Aminiphilus circumscriptus]|uniref:LmeA family phospholipid-binding protein n=1 Tax=Aminiphilus circumscriptus TaxID=290732 RepID=UPI0004785FB3|nr:DUF2993 domain-containing protein [Aminiphilus circumscriptus]